MQLRRGPNPPFSSRGSWRWGQRRSARFRNVLGARSINPMSLATAGRRAPTSTPTRGYRPRPQRPPLPPQRGACAPPATLPRAGVRAPPPGRPAALRGSAGKRGGHREGTESLIPGGGAAAAPPSPLSSAGWPFPRGRPSPSYRARSGPAAAMVVCPCLYVTLPAPLRCNGNRSCLLCRGREDFYAALQLPTSVLVPETRRRPEGRAARPLPSEALLRRPGW